MFIKNLLYFIIIFLSLNSYSNPTPLGLELNKATALDLTKKYKITGKEHNYWQGHNYFIEPNEKYISKALVKCNDLIGIVKLSNIVSKRAIFLDFRQQEVFE